VTHTPNHDTLVTKSSYSLRDIHKDIGYIMAKLEDTIDVVDECITILDELAQEYEKQGGKNHEQ